MENIFNPNDYQAIVLRFNNITPLSQHAWGKMDVDQMVVHLKDQLDIALGNKPAMAQGPVVLRTFIGRWIALYLAPWPKSKLDTPREMNASLNGMIVTDFESDKHLLLIRLNEFITAPAGFAAHPFFGKINNKDWGRLVWKHLNHHLLQFGA